MRRFLTVIVSILVLAGPALAPLPASAEPESITIDFGEERPPGYPYCVVSVSTVQGVLLPSQETCYQTQPPSTSSTARAAEFVIGRHFTGPGLTGESIEILGRDCAGGYLPLSGTVWDNRIQSSEPGCQFLIHYANQNPFPSGPHSTVADGQIPSIGVDFNVSTSLRSSISAIVYKGDRVPEVGFLGLSDVWPTVRGYIANPSVRTSVAGVPLAFKIEGTSGSTTSVEQCWGQNMTQSLECRSDGDRRASISYIPWGVLPGHDILWVWIDHDQDGYRDTFEPYDLLLAPRLDTIRLNAYGDSFSSGEGLPDTLPDSQATCQRSSGAYSRLFSHSSVGGFRSGIGSGAVASLHPGLRYGYSHLACTGAVTENVVSSPIVLPNNKILEPVPQASDPSGVTQLNNPSQLADSNMVTLTIGGNDFGFADLITYCLAKNAFGSDCADKEARAYEKIATVLRPHLAATYPQVRNSNPDAEVFVLGYPGFFDPVLAGPRCEVEEFWSEADRTWLRPLAAAINDAIRQEATAAGFHFVDPEPFFASHRFCSSSEALARLVGYADGIRTKRSFHPNELGQRLYNHALENAIGSELIAGASQTQSGLPTVSAPQPAAARTEAAAGVASTAGFDSVELAISGTTTDALCESSYALPGSTVTASVSGLEPSSPATLQGAALDGSTSVEASMDVDADGSATTTLTIPPGADLGVPYAFAFDGISVSGAQALAVADWLQIGTGPCTRNDAAVLDQDSGAMIEVLSNDSAPAGTTLGLPSIHQSPLHGRTRVLPDGRIEYTSSDNDRTDDSFGYTVCLVSSERCSTATVVIDAAAACTIVGDGSTIIGTSGDDVICGTTNDEIIDGGGGNDIIFAGGGDDHIRAVGGTDTVFGGSGADSVIADQNDYFADLDPEDSLYTQPSGTAPVSIDDSVDLDEDGLFIVTPLSNDSDAEGDIEPLTFQIISGAEVVTNIELIGDGGITVTGFVDSLNAFLTYEVCDSTSRCSTASITAIGQIPPTAVDDEIVLLTGEQETLDALANDTDPNNDIDPATLAIIVPPTIGTATVVDNGNGPEIRYAAPATPGNTIVIYEICDVTGLCDEADISVTVLAPSECTILGTTGPDVLIGTAGDDVICGLSGADTIRGRGGNDLILGGAGNDDIRGGSGDDEIRGGRGKDVIDGNGGNDVLRGGRGADVIAGSRGDDDIDGGPGADDLSGGVGADTIKGGKGADVIHGNDGNDVLRGNKGNDVIAGGSGRDLIFGGRGDDLLQGNRGDDELFGRLGDDELFGDRGDDVLRGGRGFDSGSGGRGFDRCVSVEDARRCEY